MTFWSSCIGPTQRRHGLVCVVRKLGTPHVVRMTDLASRRLTSSEGSGRRFRLASLGRPRAQRIDGTLQRGRMRRVEEVGPEAGVALEAIVLGASVQPFAQPVEVDLKD